MKTKTKKFLILGSLSALLVGTASFCISIFNNQNNNQQIVPNINNQLNVRSSIAPRAYNLYYLNSKLVSGLYSWQKSANIYFDTNKLNNLNIANLTNNLVNPANINDQFVAQQLFNMKNNILKYESFSQAGLNSQDARNLISINDFKVTNTKVNLNNSTITANVSLNKIPIKSMLSPSDQGYCDLSSANQLSNSNLVSNVPLVINNVFFDANLGLETTLSKTTLGYSETLWKIIFGINDQGYFSDVINNQQYYIKQLMIYMNSNIPTFFSNPFKNTRVSSITLSKASNTQIAATINFSGVDSTGHFNSAMSGTMLLDLRNDPPTDGSDSSTNQNVFIDFRKYLQSGINQLHYFPDNVLLKEWVVHYLDYKKPWLPRSWWPTRSSGAYSELDINIALNPIITNGQPYKASTADLKLGAIELTNPLLVKFPEMLSLSIPSTYLIQPDVSIANDPFFANKYIGDILTNIQSVNKVKDFINNNLNKIFANAQVGTQAINIKLSAVPNVNKIQVDFTLNSSYSPTGPVTNSNWTIFLTGFNNTEYAQQTKLRIQKITWNEQLFKDIFGINDKGFVKDWNNNPNVLLTKKNQLINYLNKNLANSFYNYVSTTQVSNAVFTFNQATNTYQVTVTFSGIDKFKNPSNNIVGTIDIVLRKFNNSGLDNTDALNICNKLRKAILDYVTWKHKAPTDEILAKITCGVFNQYKMDVPNFYFPNNGLQDLKVSDIIIQSNNSVQTYIVRKSNFMHIYTDAIIINQAKTNQLIIPDLGDFKWNDNNVSIMHETPWETWVKYVVIACGAILFVALFICLLVYLNRTKTKNKFDF